MQEEQKQGEAVLFASQVCCENTVKGSQRTRRVTGKQQKIHQDPS